MNRSYLFVPADSERKMKKAAQAGADALILDLEDSVAADARPAARQLCREYLGDHSNCWVRINPLDSDDAVLDLDAVVAAAPAGIVLPKSGGAEDVVRLASLLAGIEKTHGMDPGQTGIMPICTETPAAIFQLGSYGGSSGRLAAMTWGAEDLSAAVGASTNRDDDGAWLPPYELARSLCLFGAHTAEVPAIDTVYTDFRDEQGLANYAANARRDGFSGMLAIHPAQVDVINRAFVPTAAELERAARIVALFEENPGAGTLGMDGEMIDRPHLVQAQRILQLAKRLAAL
ncbi:MAG: HpcH/HpaI aldolase/citrate lyase family protein [Woeseiaceae bacterium]